MRSHLIRHLTLVALAAGLLGLAPAVRAQARGPQLKDAVPTDAYMYVWAEHDESKSLLDSYYGEILTAIGDQHFDQLALDVLAKVLATEDMERVRGLHAHVLGLVDRVPWDALSESDFLFARAMRPGKGGSDPDLNDVIEVGCHLPAGRAPAVHQGLRDLLVGLTDITDELTVVATAGRGRAAQRWDSPAEFPAVADLLGSGKPVVYEIAVVQGWAVHEESGYEEGGQEERGEVRPVVKPEDQLVRLQLAFLGDDVLFSFSPRVEHGEQGMLDFTLNYLQGQTLDTLTSSARFHRAVASHDRPAKHFFYMDFQNMFGTMLGFVRNKLESELHDEQMVRVAHDILMSASDLVSALESVSVVTYVVDDVNLVQDTVFRFTELPSTRTNPLYLMSHGSHPGRGLLEAVPADSSDFFTYGGLDLAPLHDWVLERVALVPEGDKAVAAYDGAQAVFGVDVRDDLLPALGSAMATMTFPARKPTAVHTEDSVLIARSANPAGAKRLWKRCQQLLLAGGPFVDDLNTWLDDARQQMPGPLGFVVPSDLRVERTSDPFPGMVRVSISAFGQHQVILGTVGDMWVASTTPDAVRYVLETVAGEHPNITENHDFTEIAHLPDGPVSYAGQTSYAGMQKQINGMLMGVQTGVAMLGPLLAGEHHPSENRRDDALAAFNTALDIFPRIQRVLEVVDFYDRSVTYGTTSDDGMSEFSRKVTVHKRPEQRGRVARR